MRNSIPVFALLAILPFLACNQAVAQGQITLDATSDQGTFMVEITWTTGDIGSANVFDLHFIEPETGEEIEGVVYDISIYKGGDREILRRDQTATRQEFTFDNPGSYTIRINNIEGLGEWVAIPIQVTPEFPTQTVALAVVAFGAVVIAARRNSNNFI